MDTKRLISAMAIGLALILLYFTGLNWLDTKMGWNHPPVSSTAPSATEPSTEPSSQPTTGPALLEAAGGTTAPATRPAITAVPGQTNVVPAPGGTPEPSQLGSDKSDNPVYAMQLRVLPTGAGLDGVVLNSFKKTARRDDPYVFQSPAAPDNLTTEAFASRNITVTDSSGKKATYDLNGVRWARVGTSDTSATYAVDLMSDGRKLLTIEKKFEIFPRSNPNEGYEANLSYTFLNHTDQPLTIRTTFNGPTLPPAETNRAGDREVAAGYQADKDAITTAFTPIESFKPDKNEGKVELIKDSKGHPARWSGAVSNYFGALALPEAMVGGTGGTDYLDTITAQGINIDPDTLIDDHQAYLVYSTKDIRLEPAKAVTLPLSVYFGPKWRQVLDSPHYAGYPRDYSLLLAIQGWCGEYCTFSWLVAALVGLLKGMHFVFRDWGLAIMGLVAIVRILLHPITRQSQISMAKMSKMGPEMERLRKKYADDKEALNRAMVEFHKQQGVGPYLGCLPMFLQMPIWVALYGVLQNTFELRHAPFLWNFTWIHDLAQPDYLVRFAHPVHVLFFDVRGFNLVPVLLAIAMAAQQQFMPKPVTASSEQMQQQKMMQWLSPVMFLFFFYNLPSGLNLYIFTSTAVGVMESKIIRDHLKAREEAEKAGRVFIETKPTRGSKQGRALAAPAEPKKPGLAGKLLGPLGAWWARMLEQAENVRREQERGGKKKI